MLRLLEYLDSWIEFHFDRKKVAAIGSERAHKLKATSTFKDGRSSFVFISDYNDLNHLKAVLRVQRLGEESDSKLSLESHLNIKLPREEYKLIDDGRGNTVLSGDVAELKNFSHITDAEFDFGPLLLWRAQTYGLFDAGFKTAQFEGRTYPLFPSKFYIHIDLKNKVMKRYYSYFGFQVFKEFPESQTAVMVIDRKSLLEIGKKGSSRPGQALIDYKNFMSPHSAWNWHPFEKFDCQNVLEVEKGNPFFELVI